MRCNIYWDKYRHTKLKTDIEEAAIKLGLQFTRGVDIQISGYAEKIWHRIRKNNDKVTPATINLHMKNLGVRMSFENIISAIEQLYIYN